MSTKEEKGVENAIAEEKPKSSKTKTTSKKDTVKRGTKDTCEKSSVVKKPKSEKAVKTEEPEEVLPTEGKITFLNTEKHKGKSKFGDVQSIDEMIYALKSYRKRVGLSNMEKAIDYYTNLKIPGWKVKIDGVTFTYSRPKVGKVMVTLIPRKNAIHASCKEIKAPSKSKK